MKRYITYFILLMSNIAMGQGYLDDLDSIRENNCIGWGYIHSSANLAAIEVRNLEWREAYKSVYVSYIKGVYIVQSKETLKYGLVDRENKVVVPLRYEKIDTFRCRPANIAWAKQNGKWGAINLKGETVIPFEYDDTKSRYDDDNPFSVAQNGKWGRVNEKGELVTPLVYDDVYLTWYTTTFFKKGNKWGGVNEKSEEVTPFIYDQVEVAGFRGVFLKKDGKWGMMDRDNQLIIPTMYDNISLLSKYWEHTIYCLVTKEGKKGVVDDKNRVIVPFQYGEIERE